ncbi:MAG TPA: iron-containing alcohol dehydrogenase, partial [Armatimonadetes bacterium]|nr:iron-containing alcohol dehydrogenase [Armatimonadota bacterium]
MTSAKWVEKLRVEVCGWCGRRIESCPHCGGRHKIQTEWVEAGRGLLGGAGGLIVKRMGKGKVAVVADRTTWEVAGREVFEGLRGEGVSAKDFVLPIGERPAFPTEELAKDVEEALDGCDYAVAVGSGTVNDIVKLAAHRAEVPYVVFATAPSMNGYTSAISAVFVGGLKVTTPARPPVGVILDGDVLSSAPPHMRAAGPADLVSKFAANADWLISDLLLGTGYCPLPQEVVEPAYRALDDIADGVREGDPDSCLALGLSLLLSGFSLAVAGSSAPASGGEHLVSHYLDMLAHHAGREPFALHGLQVGVGTLACARLYELLLSRGSLDPGGIEEKGWEEEDRRLRELHGPLYKFVVQEARRKFETRRARKEALLRLSSSPSEFWAKV